MPWFHIPLTATPFPEGTDWPGGQARGADQPGFFPMGFHFPAVGHPLPGEHGVGRGLGTS